MRFRTISVLTASLLIVAACSSGSSQDAADVTSSVPPTTDEAVQVTSDWDPFCDLAQSYLDKVDGVDIFAISAEDPDRARAELDAIGDVLNEMAETAPADVAEDVRVVVDTYNELFALLQELDFDAEAFENDERSVEILWGDDDGQRLMAAGNNLDEQISVRCGIDTGGSTDESATQPESAEEIAQLYAETFGLNDEQAMCLADKIIVADPEGFSQNSTFELIAECDIDIADLMEGLEESGAGP
jgi:hypothetical protein